MRVEGSSIIVTGGARGIGLASVRMLHARGARVTIVAAHDASIEEVRGRLDADGRIAYIAADVSTADGAHAAVRHAVDRFGGIDALFANAGRYAEGTIDQLDVDAWDDTLGANLKTCALSVHAALPELRKSRGTIVTMSSFNGVTGIPAHASAYGAAKAAVINLTRSLALELAPEVRVNCLAPGFVETEKLLAQDDAAKLIAVLSEMTPVGRIGTGDEIAHALVFAIEHDFLNGATINIDGGRIAGA